MDAKDDILNTQEMFFNPITCQGIDTIVGDQSVSNKPFVPDHLLNRKIDGLHKISKII